MFIHENGLKPSCAHKIDTDIPLFVNIFDVTEDLIDFDQPSGFGCNI